MAGAVVAVAVGAGLPGSAAADWPFYGHDLTNTRNAGSEGPTRDQIVSPSLEQAWRFDSPTGDFTGTPVVAGGVVVAGDEGGWAYGLDAVKGKKLWGVELGDRINGSAAIDMNAPGGPTAYVPVARIGSPHLVALSLADGSKRWDATLTKQPGASVYGSPVVWNGTVYMGTSGPNNDDATARGSVVALDQATGKPRWKTFTVPEGADGAAVWTTPAIDTDTGRLYVGTGNNYHQPTTDMSDAMLVLDARDGSVLGHYQATANDSFAADNTAAGPDYDFGASPNLIEGPDGAKLVGEGQKSGTYWALDRTTMKPAWSRTIGPGGYLGGIIGSTAYDGTRIYGANSLSGDVFGLARNGDVAWSTREGGQVHFAPTAVANGVVYTVDPSGFVIARDPATGTELARLSLGAPSFGGVSATGGALYVAIGIGPPPEPAPQSDGTGSIVAFGDTSRSGVKPQPQPRPQPHPHPHKKPRLKLRVTPRRVHARHRVTLRFKVNKGGALVRLRRHRATANAAGRARIRIRFPHSGVWYARATKPGFRAAKVKIRVRR